VDPSASIAASIAVAMPRLQEVLWLGGACAPAVATAVWSARAAEDLR
jgi:hypothetical protein